MAATVTIKPNIYSTANHLHASRRLRSAVAATVVPTPSAIRARGAFKPQALFIKTYGPSSCSPTRYHRAPRLGVGLSRTTFDILDNLLTPDRLRKMTSSCIHPVDIRALEDRYELQSDCPGMGEEDVTVEVSSDRVLTIVGIRKRKTAATATPAAATAAAAEAATPARAAAEAAESPEVPPPPEAAAAAEAEAVEPAVPASEVRYRFQRSFVLPEDADPEAITAAMDKGVLTVSVPRKAQETTKPRRVRVSGGSV